MNNVKVSIILPVYNGAKFLNQCIDSLLNQTLTDIEIIIVNDGSEDDSEKIILMFAANDSRIRYIKQDNKGVSAARNAGLAACKGSYVGFVDADDFAEPGMCEEMLQLAERNQADLVVCDCKILQQGMQPYRRLNLKDSTLNIHEDKETAIFNFIHFKYDFSNWNKLYLVDLIKRHQLMFKENLKVWEDLLFNLIYLQYAKKIITVDKCLYNYRLHETSVMGNSFYNKVEEFNGFYNGYLNFCNEGNIDGSLILFTKELQRMFYYAIIPKLIAERKRKTFLLEVRELADVISKVNKEIINYSQEQLQGIQGFKKKLLKKKWFHLFSLIALFSSLKNESRNA